MPSAGVWKWSASGWDSVSPLSRKGFAFGLRLQAWICLLPIEASASLVITRHFISDSQLDAFLNWDPEIRLWMTVALQCPSSCVFKPLSLLQNDSNLPINPFSVWRGDVLNHACLDPKSLLVSYWSVIAPLFSLDGQSKPLLAGTAGGESSSLLIHRIWFSIHGVLQKWWSTEL